MIRTTLVRSARTKTRKGAPSKPLVGLLGLKPEFYPVILAGGRGTRFWPLSRKSFAKQLLPLNSAQSMIQETVERLLPAAPAENFWIITNGDLRLNIARQLPGLPRKQIVAEPVGRNTAGAIGLAAFILHRRNPQAVLGLFPSDQVIANEKQFRKDLQTGIALAAAGENIVVMGVRPTRAETGYGYVEAGAAYAGEVRRVRAFREKPARELAEQFVAAGNLYWNSGMFLWSAETLVNALRQYLPDTRSPPSGAHPASKPHCAGSTPSATTRAWITASSSRARPRASRARTSTASPPRGAGTTWAPGRRTSSIA